ncbi:hypothetical protein SAMN06295967_11261 [Belliella buryatensis]|uniref:Outer membrane protein beta-barrel domain-containing protein n=1 Tax=Belliella buryatensis TaxID=1500549 RepID=A0A239FDC8_9BACT|nr:hypothetical protein [Belliella buryatensis]SNS54926.1 hypothetical protein SAMN06295967_11261 [Belliella buryatensis]
MNSLNRSMRYILNIIIISLFFVFGESKGQTSFHSKGVVYMLNDEKIKGEIRIENREHITEITVISKDGEVFEFRPNEIMGFKLKDGSYFSFEPKISESSFIQMLFDGRFKVYKFKNEYIIFDYSGAKVTLVEQVDEDSKRENYYKLELLTRGIYNIKNNMPFRKFKTDDVTIATILREYHFYENEKQTTYFNYVFSIKPYASLGVFHQTFSNNQILWRSDMQNQTAPIISGGIKLQNAMPSFRNFVMNIGLFYTQGENQINLLGENNSQTSIARETFKTKSFNLPITIEYKFIPRKSIVPYLGFGAMVSMDSGESMGGVVSEYQKNSGYTLIKNFSTLDVQKTNLSPIGKIGIEYKGKIFMEGVIGQTIGYHQITHLISERKINRQFISITTGINF